MWSGVPKIVQTSSTLSPIGIYKHNTHVLLLLSSWWSCPDLNPPLVNAHRSWPLLFSNWSWNALQFCPCSMLFYLGKHWFMCYSIYHKTERLHACSNMIHLWALLGLHHWSMPICLGNQKVKTLGWRGEHDPKNEGEQKFTLCIFIWLQGKNVKKKDNIIEKDECLYYPWGASWELWTVLWQHSIYFLLCFAFLRHGHSYSDVLNTSC